MPTHTALSADVLTVIVALLVIGLPGLLTGLAAGLRGWVLAGMTPLLSYAIGGLAGPWAAALGLPFTPVTYAVATALFAGVAYGLRRLTLRKWPPAPEEPLWGRAGHFAVAACVLLAAAVGMYAVVRGMGRLDAIPQGFDAVYHANGVRQIAETGDGSLFGTGEVNWYGDAAPVFYPNAYHLLASVVYLLSPATIPLTLDANTALLPALLALSLVTMVRVFRGRAVFAGAVALVSIAPVMGLYESMSRGPLLPFLLGLALTPLAAVAVKRYLDRPAPDTGFVLLVSAVGLLCVHSSALFGAILFAGPLLLQRWLAPGERWRRIGRDLRALAIVGAVAVVVAWLQLFGAIGLASGDVPYRSWPVEWRATTALGALLGFQHYEPHPQIWLSVALFLGFIFFSRAGALRWIGVTALLTGLAYIAVTSSEHPLVLALSRPWWNDPYRFMSMAAIPLSIIAAHGLAESQAWLRDNVAHRKVPAFVVAVVVFGGFAFLSNGFYAPSNAEKVAPGYANTPGVDPHKLPVSPDEVVAMEKLAEFAKPGERAVNDRLDGTVWTYALSGVRTTSGHFDETLAPSDARLLEWHFREYPSNAQVRAAVARLNVRWVILGQYGYPTGAPRQAGLRDLDGLNFLTEVYRNSDAVVYRLNPRK
ncbi:hypothetical protein DMH03_03235 [Amycolatopsis sp. WAC 01376]|uniref:DUF6541 family protein n=1 Tax=Amycolatopsis sp. WAC 01376 TaxID=2203195 RepID=UPI000F7815E7|nr:DUF6541 family protein [Amycolatopsis sp. WAC 01376]RSM66152.1 hypothetical protein DMH03_03235 [Amycolatopsis sp. WAC 01376]